MPEKSESPSRPIFQVLAGLGIFGAVVFAGLRGEHGVSPDADSYIAIAQGHLDQAFSPFSSRFLHGMLVHAISRLGLSTDNSFILVATCALPLFLLTAMVLLRRYAKSRWLLFTSVPLLLAPWLVQFFKMYYHPELLHALLVALFFVALPRRPRLALALLFIQFLVRESTILLTFSVLAVAGLHGKWRFAAEAAAVSVLALGTTFVVSSFAQPNIHHLTLLLYLVAKIVHQFAFNCLGLQFLVDKHAYYKDFTPLHVFNLPDWKILGGMTKLAFISYDPTAQLNTIYACLTTFGAVPLLLLANRGRVAIAARNSAPVIQISLLYGLLCFVTAPLLGNAIGRYLAYAWPAILIAAPALLGPLLPAQGASRAWLLALHIWLSWGAWVWNAAWLLESPWSLGCLTGLAILLYYFGFRMIKDNKPGVTGPVGEGVALERGGLAG